MTSRSGDAPTRSRLTAEALSVGHGGQAVVQDIELDIFEGCMTALLGPNGSGKSTLLAGFARLLPALDGCVRLDGCDLSTFPTRHVARVLGLLPQQPPVPEGLSVFDLVARGRFPHQGFFSQWSRQDEAAVGEALALAAIGDLADRPVETLSGGQRQRAWIAMVLAQETPLLLLDEPTTFLDAAHQVAILDLLRDLVRRHRRTVVCVLHDLNMALQYADRLVFLKGGRICHVLTHPSQCDGRIIEEVFEMPVVSLSHPQNGLPVFLPCTSRQPEARP